MISRRAFVGGTAASFAAPAVLRAEGARTLKISHQFPGGTAEHGDFRDRLCRRFAAEVETRTHGALKFDIYPGSSLMKPYSQFSAMRKGALDLSLFAMPYAGGEVHAMNLGLMPCLVTSHEQGAKWKNAAIGKALSRIAEDKGVKFLTWMWIAGGFATRTRPIAVPDDVKGLKLRGGSREMDLMLGAAGAQVSTMPSNEIYMGMQTGAVDGVLTSSTSLMSFRLEELVRFLTTARAGSIWFMSVQVMMSKAIFDSLPADRQKIILDVGVGMEAFAEAASKKDDEEVAKVFAARGVTLANFSEDGLAQWRAIAEATAWKDFSAKSSEAAELLASARSLAS
jgi:TRAP-type transport system periplasmic protein